MLKKLTRKVAAVLIAVSMLIPTGAAMSVQAAEDPAEVQTQSVTVAVQNAGGTLTVTDASGNEYVLDAKNKKTTIEAEVGSTLKAAAEAEDGYDVATYTITTDSGTEEVEITDPAKVSQDIEVTDELRTVRVSFKESEAEDEEEVEEDYGVSQGTLTLDIGENGSVVIDGVTYQAGSTQTFTYDAGTSVAAQVNADAGYEIDSLIVKDVTNNKNLYRVVDLDSPTSHTITFKVFGERTEQLIVTFDVEETEDPFDGVEGTLKFYSVEDTSLSKINSSRIYKSENGDLAYCGDASKHGPGSGISMQLDTNSSYQTALDYIMYYGYPAHTTINGKAYSAKDAHDITQIAVWFIIDPDYSGPTWRKISSTTQQRVLEFVAKANAYDGSDPEINGSALIYYPSSNKKQPMVLPNLQNNPPKGKIGVQKVSTDPAATEGNVEYTFAGATYTVKAAEDIGSSYDKGDTVTTIKVDDSGAGMTGELPLGKYTVTETKVPTSYEKDETVHEVTLEQSEDAEIVEVVKSNETPKMGHIILNKTSDHPEYSEGNKYYPLEDAVYTVYAAEDIGTKYAKGDVVTTITTDSKGYGKSEDIPFGHYTVKETTVPDEFKKDETEYEVYLSILNNPATVDVTVTSPEPIRWGYIELNKVSALPKITDGNRCYSLKGAVYDVYAANPIGTAYQAGDLVTSMVTDEDGYAKTEDLPFGDYRIQERKDAESPNYIVDPRAYDLTLMVDTPVGNVFSKELPSYDDIGINLIKLDKDAGRIPQGGATLEGAEFTVKYYDTTAYSSIEDLEEKEEPLRTWVLSTKEEADGYFAHLTEDYKVSGDELYYNEDDEPCLPVGTVTIEETKAPAGYLLEDKYLQICGEDYEPSGDKITGAYMQKVLQENHKEAHYQGGNYFAQSDKVKRGDILLQKKDENGKPLANIPFLVTSFNKDGEAIESHLIYTDDNGYYASASDFIPHSENTHAWDTNGGAKAAGTWFGLKDDGETNVAIEDDRGAFPYGKYSVVEQETEGTKGMHMIEASFNLTRELYEIDLGTFVDHPVGLSTTATNEETGTHYAQAKENVTIIDMVQYWGLETDHDYRLVTTLMDKETGEAVSGAKVTTTLNSASKDGTIDVEITFDAADLAGHDVVVFEKLYDGLTETASHEEIDDAGQTIHFPEIGTTLTDQTTEEHIALAAEEVKLTDTVSYKNLYAGKEYTMKGVLYDKETGEVMVDDNGKEITATQKFTPSESDGTVDITFTFKGVTLAGKSVVAAETVTFKGADLAVHADLEDEDQTVVFPKAGTTAKDAVSGTNIAKASEKMEIIDTVSYENLIPGKAYVLKGILMDKKTEKEALDAAGKQIIAAKEFTQKTASGTEEMTFTFDGSKLTPGNSYVVFETVTIDENPVAVHADIEDEGQTIDIPEIKTTLTDAQTQAHEARPDEVMTLVDTVSYTNLIPGKEYTMTGTLMDKATKKAMTDTEGNEITAEAKFTSDAADGTVDVVFTFDGSKLAGKSIVAFESLLYEGEEYAVHADLNDADQTVNIPKIGTMATDQADGDKELSKASTVTIVDKVSFENLTVGQTYTLTGTVMVKGTKKPAVDSKTGKEITAKTVFTPDETSGTQEVEFTFDDTELVGEELVVFEKLYRTERVVYANLIASHEDIDDKGQTVTIPTNLLDNNVPEKNTDTPEGSTSTTSVGGQPKTGDAGVLPYIILIAVCAGAVTFLVWKRKKRDGDNPVLADAESIRKEAKEQENRNK